MSKFLEGIETNMPEKDIDLLTSGKRALQRLLLSKNIKADAKVFVDELNVTLEDGTVVTLEVKNVARPIGQEEEEGDIEKTAKTAAAVLSIPDQGLGKQLLSSTARKVQLAKRKLADRLVQAADKIKI